MFRLPRLVWLRLLFLTILPCALSLASYAGVWVARPQRVEVSIEPLETTDYGPWPRLDFVRVSTSLATLVSQGEAPLRYGVLPTLNATEVAQLSATLSSAGTTLTETHEASTPADSITGNHSVLSSIEAQ
ncbi:MAG: hypothetical protein HC915_19965 [Anaerolineae bacterium]|nr:hypothetical protein [Anaerolineae bacterium]